MSDGLEVVNPVERSASDGYIIDDFGAGRELLNPLHLLMINEGIGKAEVPQMSHREAFRNAKEDAGIPKSAQYKTHKYVHHGTSENRTVYEFTVDGKKKYIIEHAEDKMGRGAHFHGADDIKGNPFDKGRYNQYDGHYPEGFNGYKK